VTSQASSGTRGLYLYALVAEPPSGDLGNGIARRPLSLLRAGRAWVVVEAIAGPPPAPRPPAIRAHDRVVRRVARRTAAVLPLRFGTIAADARAVRALLAPVRALLPPAFARVRDAVAFTIRVSRVRRARPPRASVPAAAGPGTRWLAARLAQHRVPEIDPLTEATAPFVRERRVERHDRGPELATVYHLVARADVRRWRAAVRAALPSLAAPVRVSGPFAPYAFAELA
jgi:hypothetical protein